MENSKTALQKIIISLLVLLILFNHSGSLIQLAHISQAEEIEVEEINDNEEEINDTVEENVNRAIEQSNNILLNSTMNKVYKNSILYDNETIDDNHSSIEIDESTTLEDVEIEVASKINKKVSFDAGLYIEELIKVSIKRNDTYIDSAIISFDGIDSNGVEPIHTEIVGKDNISSNQTIKILEEDLDNSGDIINLEYKMVLVYPHDIEDINESTLKGNIVLENDDENVKKEFESKDNNDEEVEKINVPMEISTNDNPIYKSYMRASAVSSEKYDTDYYQKIKIDILNSDLEAWYDIDTGIDEFETDESNIILDGEIRFIKTEISKERFDEVVGQDGFIEIYHGEETIGVIDSDAKIDNDKYVFEYDKDYDQLKFKVIGANKGTLEIENTKTIIGTDRYSNNIINKIKSIKSTVVERINKYVDKDEVRIKKQIEELTIPFEETYTKATLDVDNTVFSTNLDNEVTFDITLDTSDEKYEIFSNPSFEILLPSMINHVDIESVNLLNKNGLSLDAWNVYDNQNGNKVIKIDLKGNQKLYTPKMSLPGTQIIIQTKLKVSDLTPTGATSVRMTYTNEISDRLAYSIEGKDSYSCEASYYSNVGILSLSQLEGYNKANEKIYHIGKDAAIGRLDTSGSERTASLDITLVNNYNKDVKNVVIIGRIPSIGMVDSEQDVMNATFDTTLKGKINTSGLLSKVYYSSKLDCGAEDDSWIEDPSDFSDIKSYKVVIDEGVMSHGEQEKISYQLIIPENLGINQKAYNVCTIYYEYENQNCKDETSISIETDTATISLEECQNTYEVEDNEKVLTVGTHATAAGVDLVEGEDINYGQMVRYSYVISNDTDKPIKNIKLVGSVHNGNMYYREVYDNISSTDGTNAPIYKDLEDVDGTHRTTEMTIEELKPGESKVFTYQVFARNNQLDGSRDLYGTLKISGDGVKEEEVKTISNNIVDSDLELEITPGQSEIVSSESIPSVNNYDYTIRVKNNTNEDMDNVIVKIDLPKLFSLNEWKTIAVSDFLSGYEETETKNIVQFTIDQLPADTSYYLSLPVSIGQLDLDIFRQDYTVIARSNYNGKTYYSNDYTKTVEQIQTKFDTTIISNPPSESIVSNGDKVEYNIVIENTGKVIGVMEASTPLPEGITANWIQYEYPDGKVVVYDRSKDVMPANNTQSYWVNPGEKIKITIKATVEQSNFGTDEDKLLFEICSDETESNTIVYYINPDDIIHSGWNKDVIIDEPEEEYTAPIEETAKQETKNDTSKETVKYDETDTNDETHNDEDNYTDASKSNTPQETTIQKNDSNNIPDNKKENNKTDIIRSITGSIDDNTPKATQTSDLKIDNKHSISGKVWLDSNKDGICANEQGIADITVFLFKGEIKDSKLVKKVQTDKDGNYTFADVEEDEYYIVFDYDNENYSITKYNATSKDGIVSKCSKTAVEIDNNTKFYGISEKLTLVNNINNINLGLTSKSIFDFSINSNIENVFVKYSDERKELQEYQFNEKNKLPKIDINRKKAQNAVVTIKLAINVENTGNISGFILQLKDVLPDGFKFDEKQNVNWTAGNDNSIYYSGLSKTRLEPGETKRVYLIIYKEVGETGLGTFKNTVSIEETSNDEIIEENKENNTSSQQFVLSITTGAMTYVLIVMLLIIVLSFVVIAISHKIIPDSKYKKLIMKILILIFIVIAIVLLLINTFAADNCSTTKIMEICRNYSLDNYFNLYYNLDIYPNSGKRYYAGDDSGQQNERRVLCMEGLDVTSTGVTGSINTNNDGRGIGSYGWYATNGDNYWTYAINNKKYVGNTRSGSYTSYASRMALMGYLAEANYGNTFTVWDRKTSMQYLLYKANSNHKVTDANDFTKMIGFSYSISLNGTYYNNNFRGIYAEMSAAMKDFQDKCYNAGHSPNVDKVKTNSDLEMDLNDKIGPIHVKCPVNTYEGYVQAGCDIGKDQIQSVVKIQYFDGSNWHNFDYDVYYNNDKKAYSASNDNYFIKSSNPSADGTYYDISNKEIYIKPTGNLDLGKVQKIRVYNGKWDFESFGICFFGNTTYGNSEDTFQDIELLRGKCNYASTSAEYNFIAYKVSINKSVDVKYLTTNSIKRGDPLNYDRSTMSESGKSKDPVLVDGEDLLVYQINIKNHGVKLDSVTFQDSYDNEGLYYLGYASDTSGEVTNTASGWSKSSNLFKYTGSINTGGVVKIYLMFAVKKDAIAKENHIYINKATITEVLQGTTSVFNKLVSSSRKESTEHVKMRAYYVDLDKTVVKVGSQAVNESNSYAEPGDEVIMKIKVNNKAYEEEKWGGLYGVTVKDDSTITNGYNLSDYVEIKGFSNSVNGTFTENYSNSTDGLYATKDSGTSYTLSFGYITTYDPHCKEMYIKYKVKKTAIDINLVLTNTVKLTALKNVNGVDLYAILDRVNVDDIETSATFTIKKYDLGFSKVVSAVHSQIEPYISIWDDPVVPCQYGDNIGFSISISNMGTDANLNGAINNINISDVIDTNYFEFNRFVDDGNGGFTYDASTNTIRFSRSGGLAVGRTATCLLSVRVIYFSNQTETMSNTATILNIENTKGVTLYNQTVNMIKSDKFSDTATLQYQTYHFTLDKYISNLNGNNINGRKDIDNIDRNFNPVEVVKGDRVIYSIDFKNNTTGTNNDKTKLYGLVFKDTVQDGLNIDVNSITVKCDGSDVAVTKTLNGNELTFTFNNNYGLDIGKTLNITIPVEVTKSDFYLYNIENRFVIDSIVNRNNLDIKQILNGDDTSNNKDYVRLKNLIVSGRVWEDINENGIIDNAEPGLDGIEVRLLDITNKKYLSTYTDTNGNYNFGMERAKGYKMNNYSLANGAITYTATNTEDDKLMTDSYGRVVKATNRDDDDTGNYSINTSEHINYVIEYLYDGIHYFTTEYAGRTNISNTDLSINETYKIDSNALESNYLRDKMYDSLDTISYNKATGKDGTETELTYIKDGHTSTIDTTNFYLSAFSFGDGDNITPLWLKKSDNSVFGESEYLRYINLGLIYKSADLAVSNDLDSITTYINGEEVKYNYGQGNDGTYYSGAYVTGGEENDRYYQMKVYASDYYYQSSDYDNEVIANYKKNTELELQVKYKVTIHNKSNNKGKTYARIKEITDYYAKVFKTTLGAETTVKVYGATGDLESKQLANFTVSNDYSYDTTELYSDFNGENWTTMNKVYLQTPIDIPEDGFAEFYLTYTIDRRPETLSTGDIINLLKINDSTIKNIVELNAYSLYKVGTDDPFGLIDENSNPGNTNKDETVAQYEDDTYETKLKITKRTTDTPVDTTFGATEDSERVITGYVWEDARSEVISNSDGEQYVGNGIFRGELDKKNPNAMSLNNFKDKEAEGITAHLIEEIRIKQSDGSYKLYEYDWGNSESLAYKELSSIDNQRLKSTSNNVGKYELRAMIPGIYKVRFYYGSENRDGNIGETEIKYNGQDFKSTKYTGTTQDTETINKLFGYEDGINSELKAMINENQNDAADDELRRLETMTYAEVQTNSVQSVINQSNIVKAAAAEKEEAMKEYVDKTQMYADTGFMKLNTELTQSGEDYELNRKSFDFTIINDKLMNPNIYDYKINNIDFGLEYRAKNAISLNKYIKEFKVTLTDKTVLADIKFDEVYDTVTHALIGTVSNRDESTGMENVMITEDVNNGVNPVVLTVDDSIMQGASIWIDYVFAVKNEGEIDRIGINLDNLRKSYESVLNSDEKSQLINETISAIAYNRLKLDYGISFDDDTIEIALGKNLSELNYKSLYDSTNDKGYYGKYLGTTYYTDTLDGDNNDVIAKTKISGIIDYVPTEMDYNQDENIGENRYWSSLSLMEASGKYVDESVFEKKNGDNKVNIYDEMGKTYYDYSSGKSNMALSVDETRYTEKETDHNKSLSRFLIPLRTGNYTSIEQGKTPNSGMIYLITSATLSNEEQFDDLQIINTAEIVEIVSQTGRSTPTPKDKIGSTGTGSIPKTTDINIPDDVINDESLQSEIKRELTSTIGNHEPKDLYDLSESDMYTADPIILIPPTGIVPFYLRINSKRIITISASIIALLAMIIIGNKKKASIKKFLKKKKISLKKYYK